MATKTQQHVPTRETPASSSCYWKKPEASTFFENMKLRIDEFVNAPMDQHKACFKNTIQKVRLRMDEFVNAPMDENKACFKNTIQKVTVMPQAIKDKISLFKEAYGSASAKN